MIQDRRDGVEVDLVPNGGESAGNGSNNTMLFIAGCAIVAFVVLSTA